MIWVQLVWFIVTLIVSVALGPKPPSPKPASLEDFDIPVAERDRSIPVLFGKKEITGPNITWYGDLSPKKIKKRSGFSKTTVGYKYHLGYQAVLGHGPFDRITRIRFAEKQAWSGSISTNGTIDISQPGLFGGEKGEGGVDGIFDVCFGAGNQTVNPYLDSKIPGDIPAYRGVTSLVWHGDGGSSGGYIGTTKYLKPLAVTAERYTQGWFNDVAWNPTKAEIPGKGMNPAHIIYQCITDPRWGQGSPVGMIDEDDFEFLADTLYDEGFGLNLLWNRTTTIEDFIGTVLQHIGGILVFNRLTNKYQVVLVRGDYDPEDLALLTGSNVIKRVTKFQRRTWGETVNEYTVVYTDPETWKETPVTLQDLGNINAQQSKIDETGSFTGIQDPDLAVMVCGRELAAKSTPLAKINFTANRLAWPYKQGSVIRITWPDHELDETVFRVLHVRGGTLENGEISVEAIEDIYSLTGLNYIQVPAGEEDEEPPELPDDQDTDDSISGTGTEPPPTPAVGSQYVVTSPATGDWEGHEGQLAEYDPDDPDADENGWVFTDLEGGHLVYDESTGEYVNIIDGVISPLPWDAVTLPLSAKGDLLTHDGSDIAILGVGTNGQLLEADDTAPNGIAWKDRSGGEYLEPIANGDVDSPDTVYFEGDIVFVIRDDVL